MRFLLRLTSLGLRNVRTAIFCDTYSNIYQRQFVPAMAEFPEWLGYFNQDKLEFRFHEKWGAHVICFLNADDASKYKSAQFATIGVEELTEIPNPIDLIDRLSGSLRWPGVHWSPMGFTTNPDGPGHSQVKGLFITGEIFSHPDHADKDPHDFNFVRALPSDNPHLPPEYIARVLDKLPPVLRKAWRDGSWDLFQGQRFMFNPGVHLVDDFDNFDRLRPCRFYCSVDYGFNNPFAAGWYAVRDSGAWPQVYKVHEHSESGLTARQQAQKVKAITEELGIALAEPAFLDTRCWAVESDGLSIAQKFEEEGVSVQQVQKDRVTGWVYLEDVLAYEIDRDDPTVVVRQPRMKICRSCVLTASQITDALWDPAKPGDIKHPESFRDDNLDETRYFILTHFTGPPKQKEETRDEYHERVWKAMTRSDRIRRRYRR